MKSASLFVVLVLSLTILALASVMVDPAAAADPVIVGKWDRTDGVDVYTIYSNHVTETVIEGQTYRGTWEYDGADGYKYIFRWEHSPPGQAPFVDYVTVAADGQSYSGVNNYGDDFHCVRVGDADSTPVAESGFPVIPVAVGGGIAAIAVGGAAAYYFFIAKQGAESAAGAAGSAGGGSDGEQIKEVADRPLWVPRPKPTFSKGLLGTPESIKQAEDGFKLQTEMQKSQQDRLNLQEQVQDQLKKTEIETQQNRTNTQKKIKEQMQQELKDQSQAAQEAADSGESSSAET
jgi:hypothetical protein